jgi:hypothetical protein
MHEVGDILFPMEGYGLGPERVPLRVIPITHLSGGDYRNELRCCSGSVIKLLPVDYPLLSLGYLVSSTTRGLYSQRRVHLDLDQLKSSRQSTIIFAWRNTFSDSNKDSA